MLVSAVAFALHAVHLHLLTAWGIWGRAPGEEGWAPTSAHVYAALLAWGSPGVSLILCASLLALILRPDPLHSGLAAALSSTPCTPLADLAYSVYLMHDFARLWVIQFLLPTNFLSTLSAAHPVAGLAVQSACVLAAGYACALPVLLFVERRFF